MAPATPIQVFISYAHEDANLVQQLCDHLANLEVWQKKITVWTDRRIGPGEEWKDKIDEHLESSKIILLLISRSFMKSQYCYDVEVKRAMARHNANTASVIPVIMKPCDWSETPFEELQALPMNGKPVASWKRKDEAFLDIVRGIRKVVEGIQKDGKVEHLKRPQELEATELPDVRPLLPYLCDRHPQIETLKDALDVHNAELTKGQKPPRPLVWIIHGEAEQDPEWFERRLIERYLPDFFKLNRSRKSVHDVRLLLNSYNVKRRDVLAMLRTSLAETLVGQGVVKDVNASKEDMLRSLAGLRRPIMIYAHVTAENWRKVGRELSRAFLEFWNSWPTLPPGFTLMAALLVRYDKIENAWFFQKWRYEIYNVYARWFLGRRLKLIKYPNVHAVLLPELGSVDRTDVENWISDGRNFDRFCERHQLQFCNPDQALEEIKDIFKRSEALRIEKGCPVIPMNPLAKELQRLLETNRCRRA